PAFWAFNIDGEEQLRLYTDNAGLSPVTATFTPDQNLDTTKFMNGNHELYIGVNSDHWPSGKPHDKSYHNWRIALSRTITIENGHTLMDLAANFSHIYLQPGQSIKLTCKRLFTDNTSDDCNTPSFRSNNTMIATVSENGTVMAGNVEGFTIITLSEAGKSILIYVLVLDNLNIPHFTGNGKIVNRYIPHESLFVMAPFVLQPSDLQSDPNLIT